ncbi:hypothetical protein B0H13DRAFT_1867967 [Mycena leptocephala]|nr:hypothetical protein B0H13DRAFT_1867967 [Mycena leptocephala]
MPSLGPPMLSLGLETEVPRDWINHCANIFGPLVYELQIAALTAEGIEWDNIVLLQLVTKEHRAKRGRPSKNIDSEFLKEAVASNRDIKLGALAAALGVHRNTLRKCMRELGLKKMFDNLGRSAKITAYACLIKASALILAEPPRVGRSPDQGLTRQYKARKPTSVLCCGHFRRYGLRVQRERAHHSLRRVDALGQALQTHLAIRRC